MGELVKQFGLTYGETDTVWIVPFPYWVDTRLPAIYAGIPNRDFAMFPENLPNSLELPGPKLFIVKANLKDATQNDQKSLDTAQTALSAGHSWLCIALPWRAMISGSILCLPRLHREYAGLKSASEPACSTGSFLNGSNSLVIH